MISERPEIRRAVAEDSAKIREVLALIDAEDGGTRATEITEEHLRSLVFCAVPKAEAILAELGGRIVGLIAIHESASTFWCRPEIYVDDLFVVRDSRRRGIGRRLIQAVSALALERSATRLLLNVQASNSLAVQFYESLGGVVFPDSRCCAFSGTALTELGSSAAV